MAAQLREAVDGGARGLKVWKNLGLHLRDDDGALIAPDDEWLSPLWEAAADVGIPVLIHTGDPLAFFDPMDDVTNASRNCSSIPTGGSGTARGSPRSTICWGRSSASWRVTRAPPSSARTSRALRKIWRGSGGCSTPTPICTSISRRASRNWVGNRAPREPCWNDTPPAYCSEPTSSPRSWEVYAIHFRFLETADESFAYSIEDPPPQGRWAISGLDLPEDVLRAVYRDNALRLIPGLDPS